jgi:hypothetical protein
MWSVLGICSGFLLGVYDALKKYSLNGNAVLPTLLISLGGRFIFLSNHCRVGFCTEFFQAINLYARP